MTVRAATTRNKERISNLKSSILFMSLLLVGCQSINTQVTEDEPPADAETAAKITKTLTVDGTISGLVDPMWLSHYVLLGPNYFLIPGQSPRIFHPFELPLPKQNHSPSDIVVYGLGTANSPYGGSQPLTANRERIRQALELLGFRQSTLEPAVIVTLDADKRLRAEAGPTPFALQQSAYVPLLVKFVNSKEVRGRLSVTSPQAGPVYGGEAQNSLVRQGQTNLSSTGFGAADSSRVLDVEFLESQPMNPVGDGRDVEMALILVQSQRAGKFDAKLHFTHPEAVTSDGKPQVAAVTLSADVRPAVSVTLRVSDVDNRPTFGRFTFRDKLGRVYPSQAKRLAPDFFFQPQVYRADGETVLLPPGEFVVEYSRGPEYRLIANPITIPNMPSTELTFKLQRWIDPQARGFYSGDHHIHGAGCAHYTSPTEGVTPADMFRQIKGEGLNVGSVLTWGPCYEHQRQYFSAKADPLSEPFTVLKYDVEVSGFGSQALGHTCLLNLRDQTYPGSDGTKTKGWPTWTTPLLRWVKEQGGFTGYPHSASGMYIVPEAQSMRLTKQLDANHNDIVDRDDARGALLPEPFAVVDADRNGRASLDELEASHRRAADALPNYAVPEMNGGGAMEICVSAAHGVCDFISAMDTERIQEWNTWYHLLNCGLKVSCAGETDFPCMSSTRVGQGRTYVYLGKIDRLDYAEWCRGLAEGRSYVSDGYAHALDFAVDDHRYGDDVRLTEPGRVTVTAEVAFGSQTPPGVPYGVVPTEGRRAVGDTRTLYPAEIAKPQATSRRVEVVVNGEVVARQNVAADDQLHKLTFSVPIEQSSWVAVRQFPQLHTNPIRVLVGDRPIRASHRSAEWCIAVIEQLWRTRAMKIAEAERPAAEQAFEEAKALYRRIAAESRAEQLR